MYKMSEVSWLNQYVISEGLMQCCVCVYIYNNIARKTVVEEASCHVQRISSRTTIMRLKSGHRMKFEMAVAIMWVEGQYKAAETFG